MPDDDSNLTHKFIQIEAETASAWYYIYKHNGLFCKLQWNKNFSKPRWTRRDRPAWKGEKRSKNDKRRHKGKRLPIHSRERWKKIWISLERRRPQKIFAIH